MRERTAELVAIAVIALVLAPQFAIGLARAGEQTRPTADLHTTPGGKTFVLKPAIPPAPAPIPPEPRKLTGDRWFVPAASVLVLDTWLESLGTQTERHCVPIARQEHTVRLDADNEQRNNRFYDRSDISGLVIDGWLVECVERCSCPPK